MSGDYVFINKQGRQKKPAETASAGLSINRIV
jgi:hypothetical protein